MENSGNVFFNNEGEPEWYLAVGDRHIGPFSAADIYQKILAQEISWAHYIWRKGEAQWQRICDVTTFKVAVPNAPGPIPKPESAIPAKGGKKSAARSEHTRNHSMRPPGPEERTWFLYYNQTQFGPFSQDEVNRLILVGRVHGRVHAWKNGLPNWERLERLADFKTVLKSAAELPDLHRTRTIELDASLAAQTEGQGAEVDVLEEPSIRLNRDKRSALRAPLVAKILMTDEKGVTVGLCRDISIGGMQVLTDRIPGKVGARIRLNVSSLGDEASGGERPQDRVVRRRGCGRQDTGG